MAGRLQSLPVNVLTPPASSLCQPRSHLHVLVGPLPVLPHLLQLLLGLLQGAGLQRHLLLQLLLLLLGLLDVALLLLLQLQQLLQFLLLLLQQSARRALCRLQSQGTSQVLSRWDGWGVREGNQKGPLNPTWSGLCAPPPHPSEPSPPGAGPPEASAASPPVP